MENNVKSYRKPYVRPVKANWWTDRGFYIAYMIREATAVLAVVVALELLVLSCMSQESIVAFLKNPLVILVNILSLASVMYHTITWFNLMPKAVRMFATKKPTDTKLIPAKLIVSAEWLGAAVAFAVIVVACVCLV